MNRDRARNRSRLEDDAPPDPSPFLLEGGPVGMLLLHGFSGSPAELRLLGAYLHERGLTVSAPLLPGHGTTPDDLDRYSFRDWLRHACAAYKALDARSGTVFVGGLSFGAAIALHIARPASSVAGVLAFSPAVAVPEWYRLVLPMASLLLRPSPSPAEDVQDSEAAQRLWSYSTYSLSAAWEVLKLARHTRKLVPGMSHPLLIIRSARDRTIPPVASELLYDRVAAEDKRLITLRDSGHVVTADREWRRVAEECWGFVRARSVWHNDPRGTKGTGD